MWLGKLVFGTIIFAVMTVVTFVLLVAVTSTAPPSAISIFGTFLASPVIGMIVTKRLLKGRSKAVFDLAAPEDHQTRSVSPRGADMISQPDATSRKVTTLSPSAEMEEEFGLDPAPTRGRVGAGFGFTMSTIKVLAGDFRAGMVMVKRSFTGQPRELGFNRGMTKFGYDLVSIDEIDTVNVVERDKSGHWGSRLGWGAAMGALLGPAGAIGGAIGAAGRDVSVAEIKLFDGRKALVQGKSKEIRALVVATFR